MATQIEKNPYFYEKFIERCVRKKANNLETL